MNDLNLLMVHADDHQPMLDSVSDQTVGHTDVEAAMPEHLWDEGGDPNDLFLQRWGVIAPEGPRGDRLLEIVAPLIAHRREQQQGEEVRVYRVPSQLSASDAAIWKKKVFRTQADLDIEVPRYQLVLGDLHEVPLATQQVQGSDGYVGRLAFERDEDYAAYVDKVLRWERAPAPQTEGRVLFHTVHDGTAATQVGYRTLIAPGMAVVRQRMERGQFNADQIVESGDPSVPDPQELLNAVRTDRPGFLFSLSHGEGPPRAGWDGGAKQRDGQGAMSFGREGRIRGDDLREATFMPGGVWFMLACFGAGSPSASGYRHWLAELGDLKQFRGRPEAVLAGIPEERPFIAAVPQAVLASPNGPLGFFGHIDLAWTYSFQELDQGPASRPGKFMGILRSVLKRDRLGVGFRELYRYFEQANTELSAMADEDRAAGTTPDAARRIRAAHLWMLRQDLSAYVLLGDPAARLPLSERGGAPAQRPAANQGPVPPAAPVSFGAAPVKAPEPAPLPLPIDRLEEAIFKLLLGDESPKQIAAEYGIDRNELRRLADEYQAGGRRALGARES
jgi:hypothetical protein